MPEEGQYVQYLKSFTYSSDAVAKNIADAGMYIPLTGHQDLFALSPWQLES